MARMRRKFADRKKVTKKTKPVANVQGNNYRGGGADVMPTSKPTQVSKPSPITRPSGMPDFLSYTPKQEKIGFGVGQVDPKLAQAAGITQGIQGILPQNIPFIDGSNKGGKDDDAEDGDTTVVTTGETEEQKKIRLEKERLAKEKEEADKKEKEKKDKALETAKELTDWWKKNNKGGYRAYGDRTTLGGKVRNSQEAVTAKIQDKLNKGYYKIVNGPQGQPLIIHASTGTPVNPYTGGIISTQAQGDQGGAYQNEMAKITGIDPKFAGVFSKEYQTGNGLSVGEMKPEHALRFLMKKNKGAFEQFFSMNKDKAGFNPFSLSFISTGMGAILNKITGPEALQVGNNLERAGWGKAIKGEDGKYTIKLTEKGAENWSNSFNFDTVSWKDKDGKLKSFEGFTSPAAIAKDQKKGYLSEILGTKKYFDPSGVASNQPVDLTNLIEQGGYAERTDLVNPLRNPSDPSSPNYNPNLGSPDFADPIPPQQVNYGFMPSFTPNMDVTGTPSSFTNVGGSTTNYPAFTPEGYKISSYNPTRDYSGGTGQTRTGDGGGDTTPDPNDPTDPNQPGPLTYDVYGRPITYDYTGGPEQIYLGGGYKRDGQYIGSPYGYSKGGIANFKPYGY
jgi:hypothetical protein